MVLKAIINVKTLEAKKLPMHEKWMTDLLIYHLNELYNLSLHTCYSLLYNYNNFCTIHYCWCCRIGSKHILWNNTITLSKFSYIKPNPYPIIHTFLWIVMFRGSYVTPPTEIRWGGSKIFGKWNPWAPHGPLKNLLFENTEKLTKNW